MTIIRGKSRFSVKVKRKRIKVVKTVKAVAPYKYNHFVNFKAAPYEAWKKFGGQVAPAHYPPRFLHGLAFRYEIPKWVQKFKSSCALVDAQASKLGARVQKNKSLRWSRIFNFQFSIFNFRREARLRFVEPVSLYFDTFPDYALYEVIPFFWDVWPESYEKVCSWLKEHDVRTSFFTSSQTAERVGKMFPKMNVIWCPEAIDTEVYKAGWSLKDREYDYLEYGRCSRTIDSSLFGENIKVLSDGTGNVLNTREKLIDALANTRINICFTRLDTNPESAGDIDTLTQRFWECMLSGCVIIGRAPKELIDMIGYNPVVDLELEKATDIKGKSKIAYAKIKEILANIESYQDLVNKNRQMALKYGDWSVRMRYVMEQLLSLGYKI